MGTFYLPSYVGGYATQNEKILFRIIVTEANTSSNQRIRVQVYAYRTDNEETDGRGSINLYINDFEKYNYSFSMGEYPINSSGVYMADEYITLDEIHQSIKVTAKISIPNTTAGTVTNGGNISFTTYTISYNANGGSNAPSAQKKYYDMTLTLSDDQPTRAGWNFGGWGITNNDREKTYSPEQDYKENKSITLYAIWHKNIKLTFDPNGGKGGNLLPTYGTIYNSEDSYTFNISHVQPTRDNYSFIGWSKSSSAKTADYFPDGSITLSKDTVLYAVWEPLNVAYIKQDGKYQLCHTYIKTDGTWRQAIMFQRINNIYHRSTVN